MAGPALFTDPFAVGAVVTAVIALAFWLNRRFRLFSFFGTAILAWVLAAVGTVLGTSPARAIAVTPHPRTAWGNRSAKFAPRGF